MKVITSSEELQELLFETWTWWYPKWVVKNFQLKVALLESCQNSTEMYKLTTLRVHKLQWKKDEILAITLTYNYRLEIKMLQDWVIEIVELIRISNHYQ